jgi:hypothetical protein
MTAGAGGGGGGGGGGAGRFTVPLQRPKVRASLFLDSRRVRVRMTVRVRRSSWADTGSSVAWAPLLP